MATKDTMTTASTYIDTSTNRSFSFSNSTMTSSAMFTSSDLTFIDKVFAAMGVVSAVSAALILACCLLLFVVVLSSAELRRQTRNHVLLSLTLAHFCVGVLDTSFSVDSWTKQYGCFFHMLRSLMLLSAENFVSMWAVVQMLALYAARLRRWEGPECLKQPSLGGGWGGHHPRRRLRQLLHVCLVSAPWLVSLLVILPVTTTWLWRRYQESGCSISFSYEEAMAISSFSYYLPALVLIPLCVVVVILHRSRRERRGRGGGEGGAAAVTGDGGGNTTSITLATITTTTTTTSNSSRAEMGQALVERDNQETGAPLVYLLTAGFSLLCLGPNPITYPIIKMLLKTWSPYLLLGLYVGFELINELVAVLHIITWFVLFADLRQRLKELVWMILRRLPCCQGRAPPESSGATHISPMSFRDLSDE